jgi:hypothetical protein
METRSKKRKSFDSVTTNTHIFFPDSETEDDSKPSVKPSKSPVKLSKVSNMIDDCDEYKEEYVDEEYDEEEYMDEEEYIDEDIDYLKDSDIRLLHDLKKTNNKLFETFKSAKEIIKSREIPLIEILSSPIQEDKRADLIEKYFCLSQFEPCSEEYLELRDDIRHKYYRYITENMNISLPLPSPSEKTKKTVIPEKEDEIATLRKRLKVLECSEENKKVIEEKIQELEDQYKGDERSKIKRWITSALALPFDKLANPKKVDVENKIQEVYAYLDKELYGMKNVKERLMLFLNKKLREPNIKGCNIALIGIPGTGKCLGRDTPVIMYDGTVKMVQDVQVGDQLMGDDSKPRNILSLARGKEKMYKIKQVSGDDYIVNESHILSLKLSSNNIVDIPLMDYCQLSNEQKHDLKGFKVGVEFPSKQVPHNPYMIGLWLGDGSSGDTSKGLSNLSETNLINNKHIPLIYKANDREVRLQILAGIIDRNGYLESDYYEITQKNKTLVDDIAFLCRSLGFYTSITITKNMEYRIYISGKDLDTIPVLCHTKKASSRKQIKDALNTDITIEPLDIDDYYGFEIDGNHRFLLGDFTVTHNTRIAKCLAKCLDIPFAQVSFGGVTNPEFLTGHEYTYVGSRCGEISRCLTRMGSKNGILFCDEFSRCADKKDIMASLLHITDTSQNFEFRDNYFPELTQDLSKLWFVYSMNDLPEDQAMLDRLEIINVSPYSVQDRKKIAENYLIPKFMKDIGLKNENLEFTKEAIDRIVQKTGDGEKGVRDLERKINLVVEKSFFFISNKKGTYSYPWYSEMQKNLKGDMLVLTPQIVDHLLDDENNSSPKFMSMYL